MAGLTFQACIISVQYNDFIYSYCLSLLNGNMFIAQHNKISSNQEFGRQTRDYRVLS